MDSTAPTSGKSYIHKTIGDHPCYTALLIAVLVVLILVLGYYVHLYKGKCGKNTFASGNQGPNVSPFPQVGPPQVCGRGWDPAASAEAQALAVTGALVHDTYGDAKLQGAVDGAFDTSGMAAGLNDEQLTQLMHQGETP